MFDLTRGAQEMIRLAAQEAYPRQVLYPPDFLLGAMSQRTGALAELCLFGRFDVDRIKEQSERWARSEPGAGQALAPFGAVAFSPTAVSVIRRADSLRRAQGQGLISQGNLLQALFTDEAGAELLGTSLSGIDRQEVLEMVSEPRDMVVHLGGFGSSLSSQVGATVVRRALTEDREALLSFVREEFGERWIGQVGYGFTMEPVPIFLALLDGAVSGFACYNVARERRGVFGPMGTAKGRRGQGVGRQLLLHCLADMERLRYDYAVIKNAGPTEFYGAACGAVVIPKSSPGGSREPAPEI